VNAQYRSKIRHFAAMDWLLDDSIGGNATEIYVSGDNLRHAMALRLRSGDVIGILNGAGTRYECRCVEINRNEAKLVVQSFDFVQQDKQIAVCMGILESRERLEYAVEKVTELGATHIVLIASKYSQPSRVRLERLDSKIRAAVMQSGRAWLPFVSGPLEFAKALELVQGYHVVIGDQFGEVPSRLLFPAALFIGPEGGFDESEKKLLDSVGAIRWRVGRYRLRTETAAVVLTAAAVQSMD